MKSIDIRFSLNNNLNDIVLYNVEQKSSNKDNLYHKIKVINDYILSQLLVPLRQFSFPYYNIRYNLTYKLFFINELNEEELTKIVNDIKDYLEDYVSQDLSEYIELINVSYNKTDNILQIQYRLLENGEIYGINLNLLSRLK